MAAPIRRFLFMVLFRGWLQSARVALERKAKFARGNYKGNNQRERLQRL
jgi:hypothetical protein